MDVLAIVGTAVTSMLCSEMVGWFFVYRTARYKNAVARVKKLSRKYLEAKKAPPQERKVSNARAHEQFPRLTLR